MMSTTVTNNVNTSTEGATASDAVSEFASRQIALRIESREQAEGQGARVRRSIGTHSLRHFDPFLMLDEFNVDQGAGFPDHPHRGFETVTYILNGQFEHEDFVGHRGKIGPGDLQWMTAGRGIVHSEMPLGSGVAHGLQLWVNLKKKDKMCEPAYQELQSKDVAKVTEGGIHATVISGTALGVTSPVYTRTPTYYIHFTMQPNTVLKQKIPAGMNSFLYTLSGNAYVGGGRNAKTKVDAHYTITLDKNGEGVIVETDETGGASFVLLAGEPTNEPVVQHGPFVMNTREEIQQAFMDYQLARNGFERSKGWASEIGAEMLSKNY